MNKSMGMYIIGVILILGAAILFMMLVNQTSEKSISVHLDAGQVVNKTVSLRGNKTYALMFRTDGNVSYSIYSPHSTKMAQGFANGTETVILNTTEDGKHIISLRNTASESVDVTVVVMSEDDLGSLAAKELGTVLMCIIGVVVVLAGIVTNIKVRR